MNKLNFVSFAIFSLFLTACGSNPQSYLTPKDSPIVNIEAQVADKVEVLAKADQLSLTNRSEQPLLLTYKLFWYDKNGVSQSEASPLWQGLRLMSKQSQNIMLQKPTTESENYRIYLKGR